MFNLGVHLLTVPIEAAHLLRLVRPASKTAPVAFHFENKPRTDTDIMVCEALFEVLEAIQAPIVRTAFLASASNILKQVYRCEELRLPEDLLRDVAESLSDIVVGLHELGNADRGIPSTLRGELLAALDDYKILIALVDEDLDRKLFQKQGLKDWALAYADGLERQIEALQGCHNRLAVYQYVSILSDDTDPAELGKADADTVATGTAGEVASPSQHQSSPCNSSSPTTRQRIRIVFVQPTRQLRPRRPHHTNNTILETTATSTLATTYRSRRGWAPCPRMTMPAERTVSHTYPVQTLGHSLRPESPRDTRIIRTEPHGPTTTTITACTVVVSVSMDQA